MGLAVKNRPLSEDVYDCDLELLGDAEGDGISSSARTLVIIGLVASTVLFVGMVLHGLGWFEFKTGNHLVLGSASSVVTEYRLQPQLAQEFDRKTPEEIYKIRQREVARHTALIGGEYVPNPVIFENLSQSDRWVGTLGKYGHDDPSRATEGPSDASRLILNPLLLAAADIWPVDPSMKRLRISPYRFGTSTFRRYQLGETELPFFCRPTRIVWQPQRNRGSVTYDVGSFLSERMVADRKNVVLSTMAEVDFNMLNARDFGYKYCYTSPRFLENVQIVRAGNGEPVELVDGFSSSHSEKGGALIDTHASYPERTFLLTGKFPAKVEFLMWRKSPSPGSVPDVRFTVHFENKMGISSDARQWVDYFRGSHDALCVAGLALAEIAKNPRDAELAKTRAILASQRLEELGKIQQSLPKLQRRTEGEVKRYVSGKELKTGYSVFARASNIVRKLDSVPGYEELVAEYRKPHWAALRSLK